MILKSYIQDLLYRYDCVIVPNFGGFVTNKIGAKIEDSVIYPPSKQISFNAQLTHNDGLLVNHVASIEKLSFNEANEKVAKIVAEWKQLLEIQSLLIDNVGTISLNDEKQLTFEPNKKVNFDIASFGLAPVDNVSAIERYKEQVKPLNPVVEEEVVTVAKSRNSVFVKYAAAAAILIAGFVGANKYSQNVQMQEFANEQNALEQKIQKATFVIDDQLPTVNLDVAKKNTNHIYIIAGAFQLVKNANKKIEELQDKGFDAKIIGKNDWGLTQVSVGNYETKEAAEEALVSVREEVSQDAWILVK